MANITITIPDASLTEVVNALCDRYGYDAGSGLTKAQFAKAQVIAFVKSSLHAELEKGIRATKTTELEEALAAITTPDIT